MPFAGSVKRPPIHLFDNDTIPASVSPQATRSLCSHCLLELYGCELQRADMPPAYTIIDTRDTGNEKRVNPTKSCHMTN